MVAMAQITQEALKAIEETINDLDERRLLAEETAAKLDAALDEAVRRASRVHHRLEYWRNHIPEDGTESNRRARQVYHYVMDQLLEQSHIPYIDGGVQQRKKHLQDFRRSILSVSNKALERLKDIEKRAGNGEEASTEVED